MGPFQLWAEGNAMVVRISDGTYGRMLLKFPPPWVSLPSMNAK